MYVCVFACGSAGVCLYLFVCLYVCLCESEIQLFMITTKYLILSLNTRHGTQYPLDVFCQNSAIFFIYVLFYFSISSFQFWIVIFCFFSVCLERARERYANAYINTHTFIFNNPKVLNPKVVILFGSISLSAGTLFILISAWKNLMPWLHSWSPLFQLVSISYEFYHTSIFVLPPRLSSLHSNFFPYRISIDNE